MKVLTSISFLFLSPVVLCAQDIGSQTGNAVDGFTRAVQNHTELPTAFVRNELYGNNELPADIQGTPFFDESFKPSVITIGDKTFGSLARYNALIDVFEIKNPKGEVIQLLRRSDIKVDMDGSNHVFLRYRNNDDELKDHYFEVLEDGSYTLLKLKQVLFHDARPASSTYKDDKPARLEKDTKYYIQIDDLYPQEIKLNKKTVLSALNSKEADKITAENKWRLKEEKEVKALVSALNQNPL